MKICYILYKHPEAIVLTCLFCTVGIKEFKKKKKKHNATNVIYLVMRDSVSYMQGCSATESSDVLFSFFSSFNLYLTFVVTFSQKSFTSERRSKRR